MSITWYIVLMVVPALASIFIFYYQLVEKEKYEANLAQPQIESANTKENATELYAKSSVPRLKGSASYSSADHISIFVLNDEHLPIFDVKVEFSDTDVFTEPVTGNHFRKRIDVGTLAPGRSCSIVDEQIAGNRKEYEVTVMWRHGSYEQNLIFTRQQDGRFEISEELHHMHHYDKLVNIS